MRGTVGERESDEYHHDTHPRVNIARTGRIALPVRVFRPGAVIKFYCATRGRPGRNIQ